MILRYDVEADALYLELRPDAPVLRTEEQDSGLSVDLDESGHVRGIEIVRAGARDAWDMHAIIWRYSLDIATAAQLLDLEERRHLFRFDRRSDHGTG